MKRGWVKGKLKRMGEEGCLRMKRCNVAYMG